MSQYDFGTIDPYVDDGVTLADMLNSWRDAVHSWHRGAGRPSYVVPGMLWINDSAGPANWIVYVYMGPGAGDVLLWAYDTTTGAFTFGNPAQMASAILLAQAAATPSVRWNAIGNATDAKAWRATTTADGKLHFGAYTDAGVEIGTGITLTRDGKLIADISQATGISAGAFVGLAPPPSPVANQLWWKSDDGVMFIWYNDGNTTQWVPASPQATPPLASAWTLINKQVLAGAASSIIVDGLGGYRAIQVLADFVPVANGCSPTIRVRKGGATDTSTNYHMAYVYTYLGVANNASAGFSAQSLTGWNLGAMLVDANPRGGTHLNVMFPDITRAGITLRGNYQYSVDQSTAGGQTNNGSLIYGLTAAPSTPIDGLQFDAVAANFAAGTSVIVTGIK